ncbi:hypothetical protein RGQ29_002920 [Quercus rubra]|uniref:Aldehyde oxidase/xanthine dehydrogenase second molybdopterin binding domain-containing protein n=1 Tax=Quercus rubra TaxID=3512 RepID=A0AAN7EAE7_QUERU|nr:hypothetical protein RGQ29_002920 [Quercus rubra]
MARKPLHKVFKPKAPFISNFDTSTLHLPLAHAGALVHVYTDGNVLVTHGGVEMGQSLHTKIAQIAASAFNIPLSSVFISKTSTDKIEGAFIQGLGWVALEELKWGDATHKWIPPGCLYTCGPGSYKIPSLNDVPFKFIIISLLKGHPNVKAIHSSKAVGEPPFFLASAVFFAIKDAITAARAEVGCNDWFPLDNPATPERIRMACLDEFTAPFISSDFHPKLSV